MGNYTFESILKIAVSAFLILLFIFLSKQLYNSFVNDDNESDLYHLKKENQELEQQKIQLEIDYIEKSMNNDSI